MRRLAARLKNLRKKSKAFVLGAPLRYARACGSKELGRSQALSARINSCPDTNQTRMALFPQVFTIDRYWIVFPQAVEFLRRTSGQAMPSPETSCMDRAAGSPSWLFMGHGLETVRNKVVGKGILHCAPCDRVTNGFLAALRSE